MLPFLHFSCTPPHHGAMVSCILPGRVLAGRVLAAWGAPCSDCLLPFLAAEEIRLNKTGTVHAKHTSM